MLLVNGVKTFPELKAASSAKTKIEYKAGSVAAGSEATILDLSGEGEVVLILCSIDGETSSAGDSFVKLESDGETISYPSMFEVKDVYWLDFDRGWSTKVFTHKWNNAANIYSIGLELHHSYKQSCVVKLKNGDPSYSTAYRALVVYRVPL